MSSTAHWDSYWQGSTSLNSFGEGDAATGYQGELLQWWHSSFKQLPAAAKVVDVGTGNGAIAVAARQYSDLNQLNFTIYGTDAAQIKPMQVFAGQPDIIALLQSIQFYPGCKTEQLPFAADEIDLVTSQFAFEYADRTAALTECLRVLKAGGQFMAIMHHTNSEIAKDSATGLEVLAAFLHKTAFFDCARRLLACLAAQASQPNEAMHKQQLQNANQQLLAISQQIKQQLTAAGLPWFNDVMSRVAKLIINFVPENLSQLNNVQQSLTAFWQRLADQQQASLSAEDAALFASQLTESGYAFQLTEVQIENQLFGWLLKIQK